MPGLRVCYIYETNEKLIKHILKSGGEDINFFERENKFWMITQKKNIKTLPSVATLKLYV